MPIKKEQKKNNQNIENYLFFYIMQVQGGRNMKKFLIILITIFVSFLYVSCKEKGEEKILLKR